MLRATWTVSPNVRGIPAMSKPFSRLLRVAGVVVKAVVVPQQYDRTT